MCGFLFLEQFDRSKVTLPEFNRALARQGWRGPDAQQTRVFEDGLFLLGHNRLSILDPTVRSDQPMTSRDGRYVIVYNGEIYNHREVRKMLGDVFLTESDTETLLEGYARFGERVFDLIDGMFSLVILDTHTHEWIAARDRFGIKPLFIHRSNNGVMIGSEPAVLASLAGASPSLESISEWRIIRRPIPGYSFFKGIEEVLPGTFVRKSSEIKRYWSLSSSDRPFNQETFEQLLADSIRSHELSDVSNVSLLSGGLDSAVITSVSSVKKSYCVGLPENNEFAGAADTANTTRRELVRVEISPETLKETWQYLARLRGEPLSLPNEGLIYAVCKQMQPDEKVVLTGEGADELLFGYDEIFRWSRADQWTGLRDFLSRYGYSDDTPPTERMSHYFESLREGKTCTEFVEDVFYQVHLPGLLRRMDFASMAASKEARVPFVSRDLAVYMYRRPYETKVTAEHSKVPLRKFAKALGLDGALARRKIGFSANPQKQNSRFKEYRDFQNIVLGALQW